MRRTVRGIPAVHGIAAPHPAHRSRAALGALSRRPPVRCSPAPLPTGSAGVATPQHSHRSPAPQTTSGALCIADRMRAAAPLDLAAPAKKATTTAVPRSAPLKVAPTLPELPKGAPAASSLPQTLPQARGALDRRRRGHQDHRTGVLHLPGPHRLLLRRRGDQQQQEHRDHRGTLCEAGRRLAPTGSSSPAITDGEAPHGKPGGEDALHSQWTASEDINYDVGAAVVAPLAARSSPMSSAARACPSTPATTRRCTPSASPQPPRTTAAS